MELGSARGPDVHSCGDRFAPPSLDHQDLTVWNRDNQVLVRVTRKTAVPPLRPERNEKMAAYRGPELDVTQSVTVFRFA